MSYADFKAIKAGVAKGGKSHMKSRKGKEGWKTMSETKENEVKVFNQTDGVFASPKTFPDDEAARLFIDEYLKTFIKQGFYLTASGDRIAPKDVQLFIQPA